MKTVIIFVSNLEVSSGYVSRFIEVEEIGDGRPYDTVKDLLLTLKRSYKDVNRGGRNIFEIENVVVV